MNSETENPVYQTPDGKPNVALLQDRTPVWLRASSGTAALTLLLVVFTVYTSLLPAWHTDLWGHLTYGRWITENRMVPTVEPTLPLARGVPFIDLAWGSQFLGYQLYSLFGITSIQFANALAVGVAGALVMFAVFRRTKNLGAAALTFVAFYFAAYQQILIVRPQVLGLVCFTGVLTMLTAPRWQRWFTYAIPVVFLIWANLHASFIVGVALLGAVLVGRVIDVYLRSRNWKIVFSEEMVRGVFVSLELSLLALLINPYGIGAWFEAFAFSSNPNLETIREWFPLSIRMKQGQVAFVVFAALVAAYRFTPRRVTAREALLIAGLTFGMLWHSRTILWWSIVVAYYLGLHVAAIWRVASRKRLQGVIPTQDRQARGLWTVVCLGIVWIGFAVTPFGARVMQGAPKTAEEFQKRFQRSTSPLTPVEFARYLREKPVNGLVFHNYDWGDYLQYAGPPGVQVFMNSHAHLIPFEVWNDHERICHLQGGWENLLDRYGVQAIVLDELGRKDLIEALKRSPKWHLEFSNWKGAIFYRNPLHLVVPEQD